MHTQPYNHSYQKSSYKVSLEAQIPIYSLPECFQGKGTGRKPFGLECTASSLLTHSVVCAQLLVPAGDVLQWPEVGHKCNKLGSLTFGLLSPASDFYLGLTT